ncbi:hypothetical protein Tco_1468093 [Tanacetum coccineum]
MSDIKFADTHNLVAFLEKPTESEGFEEIFWDTVKAKTVNGEVQLQALVDKKNVIITESTIRRDLQLEDANGVESHEEMGEGSEIPTDPHHTPIITQPSSSQPQRKQKSRKSKKKNTKVPQPSGSTDNVPDENVPTTSNDHCSSGVLDEQEVKVDKVVSTTEVTTESATKTLIDECPFGSDFNRDQSCKTQS